MSSRKSFKIIFLFLILFSVSSTYGNKHRKPCKEMTVYFHDVVSNSTNSDNATASIVAAPAGNKLTTFAPEFRFGNIIVFNDPITVDSNFNSPPIGRAQGFYLYVDKNAPNSWISFSLVFNSTNLRGTINLMGSDPIWGNPVRNVSVVGGTGDFFMHTGIATLVTDSFEGLWYFRVKMDIKFYQCW
ncbi:disease resistance response protein 206-like [Euphorbia lathyris]|uniref:disease resistance response protein 206-like n=1 Tax=Euphorbia lathyris TaxID=212925 RepID=UPI0033132DB9